MPYYTLNKENKVCKVSSYAEYKKWHRTIPKHRKTKRALRVALSRSDDIIISTVFLGKPHGRDGRHPILWETAIMKENSEEPEIWRYSSGKNAIEGHIAAKQLYIDGIE